MRTRAVWIVAVLGAVAALGVPRVARRFGTHNVQRAGVEADDTIVGSIRTDPRSFNRYVARDLSTTVVTFLMHASLVRINHATHQLEPELAERWELLPDGRSYRLWLRRDRRFSDGVPFTADDVVFSFTAAYDRVVDSVLADTLQAQGRHLVVTANDASTVTIQFPSAFGPGLRILDGVPIYPRHKLAASLAAGTFRSTWNAKTEPAAIAGLGPFTLRQYQPGQRLVFDRNPYYPGPTGVRGTPKHLVLEIVPDQDAELLQLETGGIDLTQSELRPVDVAALKPAVADARISIADAGTGIDGDLLWLNLTASKARDPRARWLQHADFRAAIARAVDRRAFVDTVYFGAGVPADSIVSPGNTEWHVEAPAPSYDRDASARLLAGLGLADRNGDGVLDDARGAPVRLALLTQKGNTSLERGAAVIRESLAAVGIEVDVVMLDPAALMAYVERGNYDAAYFRLLTTDTDPALNLDFWTSGGSAHMWNPNQRTAATSWERAIDALMTEVATGHDAAKRHAAFAEVQRIVARELPVLCFGFPRFQVAVSSRLANTMPAAFRPPLLWNAGAIQLASGATKRNPG